MQPIQGRYGEYFCEIPQPGSLVTRMNYAYDYAIIMKVPHAEDTVIGSIRASRSGDWKASDFILDTPVELKDANENELFKKYVRVFEDVLEYELKKELMDNMNETLPVKVIKENKKKI